VFAEFIRSFAASLVLLAALPAVAGSTLDHIRSKASLTCGVVKEEEDYSRAEDHGNRAALDLDLCKAVAVAILGEQAKFVIQAVPDEPAGMSALRAGKIDLLATGSAILGNEGGNEADNEAATGLGFTRPLLYDGETMLLKNDPAVRSARDLAGKKICFLIETGSETGLHAYAAREHISYIWYPFSEAGEMDAAFFAGNCSAIASDQTQLANIRGILRSRAAEYTILPDLFTKDPLAPVYRLDDPQFASIVNWTVEVLIQAEESGVTQKNVDAMSKSDDPNVRLLLGGWLGTGSQLGLSDTWGANVIRAVGNYGEIFERDLGAGSPLHLERGLNDLWTRGGLMYALPLRSNKQ
jgi:general L-amino acid transport system substrate-binding protein